MSRILTVLLECGALSPLFAKAERREGGRDEAADKGAAMSQRCYHQAAGTRRALRVPRSSGAAPRAWTRGLRSVEIDPTHLQLRNVLVVRCVRSTSWGWTGYLVCTILGFLVRFFPCEPNLLSRPHAAKSQTCPAMRFEGSRYIQCDRARLSRCLSRQSLPNSRRQPLAANRTLRRGRDIEGDV